MLLQDACSNFRAWTEFPDIHRQPGLGLKDTRKRLTSNENRTTIVSSTE